MGSVQRLATVVIIGLVALSTVLVLYTADENNRIDHQAQLQQDAAVERATSTYIQYCLSCHGPAGEGLMENTTPKRLGFPLGGDTYATALNQEAMQANGTPYPGGMTARAEYLSKTIHNGKGTIMPAWGQENGGELNDQQIVELVLMIQHVDWNRVYNEAVELAGGYPTVAPAETAEATEAAATGTEAPAASSGSASGAPDSGITIAMHDIYFDPTTFTLPANTAVTIHLVNEGAAVHNFEILGQNVSIDLDPGASADLEIPALPAGEYDFECNIPGHKEAGMVGTLTVSADATLPEGAAAATGGDTAAASAADDTASPASDEPALSIEAVDIAFKPTELTVKADTPTQLTITNTGAAVHDFSIDELGIKVDLNPGESRTIEINAPAGTYEYYCSIPGHKEAGMTGTLTSE